MLSVRSCWLGSCSGRPVLVSFLLWLSTNSTIPLTRPTGRLDKFEIPFRVGLTSITWSPDNNLVTAAFKLKRKELADFYREDLRRLYK